MYKFQQKLKYIKEQVKICNKEHFGNINLGKKQIEGQLADIQRTIMQKGYTDSIKKEEKYLHEALNAIQIQESTLRKTKSRNIWLKEGERNSSFFFRETIQHGQANGIVCLKEENGTKVEMHEEIEQVITNHFMHLMEELDLDRSTTME